MLRRHRWLWLPLAVAVVLAGIGFWVVDQLSPRDDSFVQRRGTLVSAEVSPDDPAGRAFVSEAVHLTADTGLEVDLRVLRPPDSPGQRRPLVVILGGHRTGRDAVDLVGDPGVVAVAALDYPYHGPDKPSGWWESLCTIPAAQRGLLDTPPAVFLAMDWLLTQPWVDPARIELVGVSLGVLLAAVAGAGDPRFRRVWLIHGGAGIRGWIEHNLRDRIPTRRLRTAAADLLYVLAYGPTFEPRRWVGRISPRPVVIIGAASDEQLPRELVEQLFAAAGQPKELLWTQGTHVNPDRPEVIQQLLGMARERMVPPPAAAAP
jgi:dienelactone hydrolase